MAKRRTVQNDRELQFLIGLLSKAETLEVSRSPGEHGPINWPRFLELARWHRLVPCLPEDTAIARSIPAEIVSKIKQAKRDNALKSLSRKHECQRILEALTEQGIRCLVVKGPALEHLLSPLGVNRHCGDLDLLVHETDIPKGQLILSELGYQAIPGDLPPFHDSSLSFKQSQYLREHESHVRLTRANVHLVEMHWKLTPNPHLWSVSFETLWSRRSFFPLGKLKVPTLDLEDHLLFLLIHGAFHAWFRLFWLWDIYNLSHRLPTTSGDTIQRESNQHGCRKILSASLRILEKTFGDNPLSKSNHGESIPVVLTSYPSSLQLQPILPQRRLPFQSVHHFRYQFSLLDSVAAMRFALYQLLICPADFARTQLPDRLFLLYMLLRPASWIKRRILHRDQRN